MTHWHVFGEFKQQIFNSPVLCEYIAEHGHMKDEEMIDVVTYMMQVDVKHVIGWLNRIPKNVLKKNDAQVFQATRFLPCFVQLSETYLLPNSIAFSEKQLKEAILYDHVELCPLLVKLYPHSNQQFQELLNASLARNNVKVPSWIIQQTNQLSFDELHKRIYIKYTAKEIRIHYDLKQNPFVPILEAMSNEQKMQFASNPAIAKWTSVKILPRLLTSSLEAIGTPLLNVKLKQNRTWLHALAEFNDPEAMKWVLAFIKSSGVSIDAQDANGDTALHIACRNGYQHVALQLISSGASTSIANKKKQTPQSMAPSHAKQGTKRKPEEEHSEAPRNKRQVNSN